MTGSYELKGDRLAFGPIASRMMAYPEGTEIEKEFRRTLGQANKWNITGDRLNMFDAVGKQAASFEARHTK